MRIEQRDSREPARITDAANTDTAIVLRNIFQKIFDRVIRVRALVDRFRIALVPRRPKHLENALGIFATANILKYEDVAILYELGLRTVQSRPVPSGDAVRRALHVYRQILGLIFGGEDHREKLDTVAHRDHRLGTFKY
jgi:hypothetical protein